MAVSCYQQSFCSRYINRCFCDAVEAAPVLLSGHRASCMRSMMKRNMRRVLPVILAAVLISACNDTPAENGLMYRAGDFCRRRERQHAPYQCLTSVSPISAICRFRSSIEASVPVK